MPDLVTRSLAGAAAGLTATGPMTLFMAAAKTQLSPEEQYLLPPRRITMHNGQADPASRPDAPLALGGA